MPFWTRHHVIVPDRTLKRILQYARNSPKSSHVSDRPWSRSSFRHMLVLFGRVYADPVFPLRLYDFSFTVYCRANVGSCSSTRGALAKADFSVHFWCQTFYWASITNALFETIAFGWGWGWRKDLHNWLSVHFGSIFWAKLNVHKSCYSEWTLNTANI